MADLTVLYLLSNNIKPYTYMSISNSLVIRGETVDLVYSDKDSGSMRVCRPVGVLANGDLSLKIAHSPFVDSKTKVSGFRSVVRAQYDKTSAVTGELQSAFCQITVGRPVDDTSITDTMVFEMTQIIRQLIDTTPADAASLNQAEDIFNSRLQ